MTKELVRVSVCVAAVLGAGVQVGFAITFGQLDDFEDGTTMGWAHGAPSPNPPTNIPNGGPLGKGDNYVLNTSMGGIGPGGRMVMFNRAQWTGDYLAAGVTEIEASMINIGGGALSVRIGIERNAGERFVSTTAVSLPSDGQWHRVSFGLSAADLTLVGGAATLEEVLANVNEVRILSAAGGPTWLGDVLFGMLGVDNIFAGPVIPAVSDWGMVVMALLVLAAGTVVVHARKRRVA